MLLQEIKRGFSRLPFKIVVFIGSIACILSALLFQPDIDMLDSYYKAYVISAYDGFIFFNLSPISNVLILIMPILSSLSYSDSYLEDVNSGIVKFIYTRQEKDKYLITKYLANFVVSGVAFIIPLIINFIILILKIPSVQPHPILGHQTISGGGLFAETFYDNPILYIGLWIIIYFLYSGVFASVGLSLSIFTQNKFVVLVLPFILCCIIGIVLEVIDKYQFYPLSFLYVSLEQSWVIVFGEFFTLLLMSFGMFFFGGRRNEIY